MSGLVKRKFFERFTADGTYTIPNGVTVLWIECIGAGGSGAGDSESSNRGGGGGGGSGYGAFGDRLWRRGAGAALQRAAHQRLFAGAQGVQYR